MNEFVYKEGFTHGGVFHADDVFSTALLKILNPGIVIHRGNSVPEDFDGIVYDIGLGEFDHHQKDNEVRENGIPYAAFGKLWRAFGNLLVEDEYVQQFDKCFVEKVDNADNSAEFDSVSVAVCSFRPGWADERSMDDCFVEAVEFAQGILEKQIEYYKSLTLAKRIALDAAANAEDGIAVFEKFVPAGQFLVDTNVVFFVYPSLRGGYNVNCVKNSDGVNKVDFPAEWLGSKDESIGLTFCHKGNFMASADTLENAIGIAKRAIEIAGNNVEKAVKSNAFV